MDNVLPLGDPTRHFWMTRSMARTLGVSLNEAMSEGRLSQKAYADLVTNCRRCKHVHECEHWLAQHCNNTRHAPEFCQHGQLFDSLRHVAKKA